LPASHGCHPWKKQVYAPCSAPTAGPCEGHGSILKDESVNEQIEYSFKLEQKKKQIGETYLFHFFEKGFLPPSQTSIQKLSQSIHPQEKQTTQQSK